MIWQKSSCSQCAADERTWLSLGSSEAARKAACAVLDHLAPLSQRLSSSVFAAAPFDTKAQTGLALKPVSSQASAHSAAAVSPAQHLLNSLAGQSSQFASVNRKIIIGMTAHFMCIPLLWERWARCSSLCHCMSCKIHYCHAKSSCACKLWMGPHCRYPALRQLQTKLWQETTRALSELGSVSALLAWLPSEESLGGKAGAAAALLGNLAQVAGACLVVRLSTLLQLMIKSRGCCRAGLLLCDAATTS